MEDRLLRRAGLDYHELANVTVHAFERIKTNIGQDRPIDLDRATKPAARLIGKAVLVVVDAHRRERAFGEVKDFVTGGRAFAGDQ